MHARERALAFVLDLRGDVLLPTRFAEHVVAPHMEDGRGRIVAADRAEEVGRRSGRRLQSGTLGRTWAHVHGVVGGHRLASVLQHTFRRLEEPLYEAVVIPVKVAEQDGYNGGLRASREGQGGKGIGGPVGYSRGVHRSRQLTRVETSIDIEE